MAKRSRGRYPAAKSGPIGKLINGPVWFVVVGFLVGIPFLNAYFRTPTPSSQVPIVNTPSSPAAPSASPPTRTAPTWGVPDGATPVASEVAEVTADNLVLVFDLSGSMSDQACEGGGRKDVVARRSIAAVLPTIPASTHLGLIIFQSGNAREVVPIGINNRAEIAKVVSSAPTGGATPLGESIKLAYKALSERAKVQQGAGSYRIMILTDGEASDRCEMDRVVDEIVRTSPIEIHTAGFCIGVGHALNRRGETYYASANTPDAIIAAFRAAIAETDSWRAGN
jgi:hypothetical protein